MGSDQEHEAVRNFRKYLRIPSVHPDVDYDGCVQFLTQYARDLGLPIRVIEVQPRKPVVVISYVGTNPELQSVLLNSHMDVVPVTPECWSHDPFAADKDENGNIFARGAQDMKCVGIQYIETIRRYIKEGLKLKRTVHMSFVPDEEIGGVMGMALFVEREEFKKLNVGFCLDEGMPNPSDEFLLAYAERPIWHLTLKCAGTAGHGSLLHDNTAGEKVHFLINKFMQFRDSEKKKLLSNPDLTVGDVTTVNLTMLGGGLQHNVVPSELEVTFDVRIAVDVDHQKLENTFSQWCNEAGGDIKMDFEVKNPFMGLTKLNDSNPWWLAFKRECDDMNLSLKKVVFPGGTDCRFLRNIGLPAIGFSPMNNTKNLLHGHDEYLNEKVFLRGIDIYYKIIKAVAFS